MAAGLGSRFLVLSTLVGLVLLSACGGASIGGSAEDTRSADVTVSDTRPGFDGLTLDIQIPDQGGLSDTPVGKPDLGHEVAQPDLSRPDGLTGLFGDPCDDNSDCLSGYCIVDPDTGESVCTVLCVLECPEDWECRAVVGTWPDIVSICVPPLINLCEPCDPGQGCPNPADLCLPIGEGDARGDFCGRGCAVSGQCPPGYTCSDIEDEAGQTYSRQCLPDTGSCVCTAELDGTSRICERSNEHGACFGFETCDGPTGWGDCSARVPAVELCNGEDDDCDGAFDEDFLWVAPDGGSLPVGAACGQGVCSGAVVCADSASATCSGLANAGQETCNGLDDDCDGETDEVDDCPSAGCTGSVDDYFENAGSRCDGGQCVTTDLRGCGLYTCAGGGAAGDECATNCFGDEWCIASAHCDETRRRCVLDVADGGPCVEDSDCVSGHCQNGFCCAEGDCCGVAVDCPTVYRAPPVCDDIPSCQGHRVDAQCVEGRCFAGPPLDDDSGCGQNLRALDCEPFVPVHCSGDVVQVPPTCADACLDDSWCLPGFHCDGHCVPDLGDGQPCDEDTDCVSGHCQNGFCCAEGFCCGNANDCPEVFREAPVCDDPVTCQGHRREATCMSHICGVSPEIQDDTACDEEVRADLCGLFLDVFCTGEYAQSAPECPTSCASDTDCDPVAHCEDGICELDRSDGEPCTEDSHCASGHCQNGFCCVVGDCCALALDCPGTYTQAPSCTEPAACQGLRVDAVCAMSICGTTPPLPDDSACDASVVALDCGWFPDPRCTGEAEQSAPSCPEFCLSDEDCDPAGHCEDGLCVADGVDGADCAEDAHCVSGHCVAGICCATGDCCRQASDCPEGYAAPAECDDPRTCQGHRVDALCANFVCGARDVNDDSACDESVLSDACGFYLPVFCTGEAAQLDPPCPEGCVSDEDCDEGSHCDGVCVSDSGDGRPCDDDDDCVSGHCQNGYCCAEGDCCAIPRHCLPLYGSAPVCDDPATCQGSRVDATCVASMCASEPVEDDTACDASVEADDCGPFPAQYCNGDLEQDSPVCAGGCTSDAECGPGAHCDDGQCVYDLVDGMLCDEDSDCLSEHCQNGFCCGAGDCCAAPSDCPARWAAAPQCSSPASCQGSRVDATCSSHMCGSRTVDDDSACGAELVSDNCGLFVPVYCTGEVDQLDPPCPGGCGEDDSQCDPGAHCDGVCVPDLGDGAVCDEDSDCLSEHCQNGRCCASGDCCVVGGDCPLSYTVYPVCDDERSCQGHRSEAVCESFRCGSVDIDDDRGCSAAVLADECGLYIPVYCTGALAQASPVCLTSCGNDDSLCDAGAHCDGGCVPDQPAGAVCNENSDCISNYCNNGFCCGGGTCCATAVHCPPSYFQAPTCYDPQGCQGVRIDAACVDFTCGSTPALDDDSACGPATLADDCGPYPAVYCTGAAQQTAPLCAGGCLLDEECGPGAHCADGMCEYDLVDGSACEEDSDCVSGHCQNGFCCSSSDCCAGATDCPPDYTAEAWCFDPAGCQGARVEATCTNYRCGARQVADDSACDESTLSSDCGFYLPIYCSGAANQVAPQCPVACVADEACDPNAHCDAVCVPDVGPGNTCDEHSDCTTGHCENGYCCTSGICCSTAGSCPTSFSSPAVCEDAGTCQGSRIDATCVANVCGSVQVADDRACDGTLLSDNCGYYLPVFCNGAENQSEPPCPTSCGSDADCDAGAHCAGTVCAPDLGVGAPCAETSSCQSGLLCVDGVCCTSACGGLCQRCDLPGTQGQCANVPMGGDPDAECGAVSCAGYYWGWDGDYCHLRSDAPAIAVGCDGFGSCQVAGAVCPGQGRGVATLICHADCQHPGTGTCAGLTPGSCTNFNPGFESCGVGLCARTVPECVDGAPNACVPGDDVDELCDGFDNDCDGATDEDWPDKGLACDGPDGDECERGLLVCSDDLTGLVCEGDVPQTLELCNGLDDDCDGQTDEVEDLGETWCGLGICAHSEPNCVDGSPNTCDPMLGAQPADLPDDGLVDSNCDGVDGDASRAVFVDHFAGSDGWPGTRGQPVRTLQQGIARAVAAGRDHVYVSVGTYTGPFTLTNGVSVFGGYDAAAGWTRSLANRPTLTGSTRVVSASGITSPTILDSLSIVAQAATGWGSSSYGMVLVNASALTVRNCVVTAGDGGPGRDGQSGSAGSTGASGEKGGSGCEYGSCGLGICSSCSRPVGGAGGAGTCGGTAVGGGAGGDGGSNGGSGYGGATGQGTSPGAGGAGGGATQNGSTGGVGAAGSAGGAGSAGASFGATAAAGYTAADGGAGGAGGNGSGGGGGGAGGGDECPTWFHCRTYGSAGGGGGGGGCGGTGGTAGTGGGGSFGVFAWGGSPSFVACQIGASAGGAGGDGGGGGLGGPGGAGGAGGDHGDGDDQGDGAVGRAGGTGGRGGDGGGGGGGPSVALFCGGGAAPSTTGTSLVPGAGGAGGTSATNPGAAGPSQASRGCGL